MTLILSILLLLPLGYSALRCPPLTLMVFAVAASETDAFGVTSFLRSVGFEYFALGARAAILAAAAVSFGAICAAYRRGEMPRGAFQAAIAIALCAAWITVSALIKGESVFSLPAIVLYSGVPAALVTLAYWNQPLAQRLFVAGILFQVSLSATLLLFPSTPLSAVAGTNFDLSDSALEGRSESFQGGVVSGGLEQRAFAQHYNPHAYGLYAIVACVSGVSLLASGRNLDRRRIAGAALVACGAFGWVVTISRGATVGCMLGVAIVLVKLAASGRMRDRIVYLTPLLILAALATPILFEVATDMSDISSLSADEGVVGRGEAAARAFDQIQSSPLLGIPAERLLGVNKITAHQIFIYLGAAHGLVVGLICLGCLAAIGILPFIGGCPEKVPGLPSRDFRTAVVLGWTVIGMGLTNNSAASILFWSCVGASLGPMLTAFQFQAKVRMPVAAGRIHPGSLSRARAAGAGKMVGP